MESNLALMKPGQAADRPLALTDPGQWDAMMAVAKSLATSSLVPKEFQNRPENVILALDMAKRTNTSALMVMQQLYIVHGKPSFSSTFLIGAVNSCGRFSPLRYEMGQAGITIINRVQVKNMTCRAYAFDKATGDRLDGAPVSIEMAMKEGWYAKNGSKWQTMPELMLRYRAAAFWARQYAPEISLGMQTVEEVYDVESGAVRNVRTPDLDKLARVDAFATTAQPVEQPASETPAPEPATHPDPAETPAEPAPESPAPASEMSAYAAQTLTWLEGKGVSAAKLVAHAVAVRITSNPTATALAELTDDEIEALMEVYRLDASVREKCRL